VTSVLFSRDGRTLVAGCGLISGSDEGMGTILVWDAGTGRERGRLNGHSNWISCISLSPDGSFLASAGADAAVRLWNMVADDNAR
jgi:WD40 repeat protein